MCLNRFSSLGGLALMQKTRRWHTISDTETPILIYAQALINQKRIYFLIFAVSFFFSWFSNLDNRQCQQKLPMTSWIDTSINEIMVQRHRIKWAFYVSIVKKHWMTFVYNRSFDWLKLNLSNKGFLCTQPSDSFDCFARRPWIRQNKSWLSG